MLSQPPLLSPLPLHGLGRLGRIACHFLHAAAALIENLGGLAYLFSWNAAGYIFMAFSQQCSDSISNYSKKKSQSPPHPPPSQQQQAKEPGSGCLSPASAVCLPRRLLFREPAELNSALYRRRDQLIALTSASQEGVATT